VRFVFIEEGIMVRIMSESLIRRSVNTPKEIRALSLAFAIKGLYKSSQLNNWSYQKIAMLFHIGRTTAKERIQTLERMGLIKRIDNHLLFLSLKEINHGVKNITIQNYSNIDITNLKEVERFLRLQGTFIKQSQIDYAVNVKNDIINPTDLHTFKKAKRLDNKLNDWGGQLDSGQSISTVMKSCGLGRNKSVELLQWAEHMELVKKEKRFHVLSKQVPLKECIYDSKTRKTMFSHKGRVYSCQATILHFYNLSFN